MGSYTYTVRKSDLISKNFLSSHTVTPEGITMNQILRLAMGYHYVFGKYLHIGTVTITEYDDSSKSYVRNFSVPTNSLAEKYILEQKKQGKAVSTIISSLIINGVTIGDKCETISKNDYYTVYQQIQSNSIVKEISSPATLPPTMPSTINPTIDQVQILEPDSKANSSSVVTEAEVESNPGHPRSGKDKPLAYVKDYFMGFDNFSK